MHCLQDSVSNYILSAKIPSFQGFSPIIQLDMVYRTILENAVIIDRSVRVTSGCRPQVEKTMTFLSLGTSTNLSWDSCEAMYYVSYINTVESLLTHISHNSYYYTITHTFSPLLNWNLRQKWPPRSPQPLISHNLSHPPPIYFERFTPVQVTVFETCHLNWIDKHAPTGHRLLLNYVLSVPKTHPFKGSVSLPNYSTFYSP